MSSCRGRRRDVPSASAALGRSTARSPTASGLRPAIRIRRDRYSRPLDVLPLTRATVPGPRARRLGLRRTGLERVTAARPPRHRELISRLLDVRVHRTACDLRARTAASYGSPWSSSSGRSPSDARQVVGELTRLAVLGAGARTRSPTAGGPQASRPCAADVRRPRPAPDMRGTPQSGRRRGATARQARSPRRRGTYLDADGRSTIVRRDRSSLLSSTSQPAPFDRAAPGGVAVGVATRPGGPPRTAARPPDCPTPPRTACGLVHDARLPCRRADRQRRPSTSAHGVDRRGVRGAEPPHDRGRRRRSGGAGVGPTSSRRRAASGQDDRDRQRDGGGDQRGAASYDRWFGVAEALEVHDRAGQVRVMPVDRLDVGDHQLAELVDACSASARTITS